MTWGGVQRDEAELIDAARSGDSDAFGQLVWRYRDSVYTLAVRLVGPDLAPDVAQEALIRAWRAMPRFRGEAALGTWLHRITVNTAWTLRKRASRHDAQQLDEMLIDPSTGPERAGELAEVRAELGSAINQLSPGQRAVLVLRDVYGWSHAEVGRELGITQTTAKVRLHRARKRVRAILGETR
ncbi:MAG: sigma-70 family RNA polymerase sigma factor [Actinomycetota bacterium]|jgi:RNA polymerase sigma-70 factor (ECF subfamily)|nr:sigma-70 family RNA polymerase sigma factor [Actinomycetota bacterium]